VKGAAERELLDEMSIAIFSLIHRASEVGSSGKNVLRPIHLFSVMLVARCPARSAALYLRLLGGQDICGVNHRTELTSR
jgi:hypothetical protein